MSERIIPPISKATRGYPTASGTLAYLGNVHLRFDRRRGDASVSNASASGGPTNLTILTLYYNQICVAGSTEFLRDCHWDTCRLLALRYLLERNHS